MWIDCEMSGLDIDNGDRLLEVACIITDGDLEPVDDGVNYVIRTPSTVLEGMNSWCVKQHGGSGLTAACLDPTMSYDHADVRAALLAYIRDRVSTPKTALLAGNTVHADKVFLLKEMPELIAHLHYRIVDVSSIKECVRRWYGPSSVHIHSNPNAHRALDDIKGSIQGMFTPPPCAYPRQLAPTLTPLLCRQNSNTTDNTFSSRPNQRDLKGQTISIVFSKT